MDFWTVYKDYPVPLVLDLFSFALSEMQLGFIHMKQPDKQGAQRLEQAQKELLEAFQMPLEEEEKKRQHAEEIESFFRDFKLPGGIPLAGS